MVQVCNPSTVQWGSRGRRIARSRPFWTTQKDPGSKKNNNKRSWAPVAHACNPSFSGGRDQEDHGWKPAWANSSRDSTSEICHKKGLEEWLKVKARSPSPSTAKINKYKLQSKQLERI
jgi:hypothetical protein